MEERLAKRKIDEGATKPLPNLTMRKGELLEIAAEKGVECGDTMTKAEILAAIEGA